MSHTQARAHSNQHTAPVKCKGTSGVQTTETTTCVNTIRTAKMHLPHGGGRQGVEQRLHARRPQCGVACTPHQHTAPHMMTDSVTQYTLIIQHHTQPHASHAATHHHPPRKRTCHHNAQTTGNNNKTDVPRHHNSWSFAAQHTAGAMTAASSAVNSQSGHATPHHPQTPDTGACTMRNTGASTPHNVMTHACATSTHPRAATQLHRTSNMQHLDQRAL